MKPEQCLHWGLSSSIQLRSWAERLAGSPPGAHISQGRHSDTTAPAERAERAGGPLASRHQAKRVLRPARWLVRSPVPSRLVLLLNAPVSPHFQAFAIRAGEHDTSIAFESVIAIFAVKEVGRTLMEVVHYSTFFFSFSEPPPLIFLPLSRGSISTLAEVSSS